MNNSLPQIMMSHNVPLEKIFAKAWSTTNGSELVNTGRFQISELLTSQFISVCISVEIVSAAILLFMWFIPVCGGAVPCYVLNKLSL